METRLGCAAGLVAAGQAKRHTHTRTLHTQTYAHAHALAHYLQVRSPSTLAHPHPPPVVRRSTTVPLKLGCPSPSDGGRPLHRAAAVGGPRPALKHARRHPSQGVSVGVGVVCCAHVHGTDGSEVSLGLYTDAAVDVDKVQQEEGQRLKATAVVGPWGGGRLSMGCQWSAVGEVGCYVLPFRCCSGTSFSRCRATPSSRKARS